MMFCSDELGKNSGDVCKIFVNLFVFCKPKTLGGISVILITYTDIVNHERVIYLT